MNNTHGRDSAESGMESSSSSERQTTIQVKRLWKAWMAGERSELDRILAEDPLFQNDQEALIDLVYSEYWLRKQLDPSVNQEEYFCRFPQIANVLRTQFELASDLQLGRDMITDDALTLPARNNFSIHASMAPNGFEPIELIGVGGMGVVIKARHLSLQRDVAIKSLKAGEWVSDTDRIRLRTEARVVAQLQHPNVVQIFDVIEENGKLFLIMEYVAGKSLAHEIADRKQLHEQPHGGSPAEKNEQMSSRSVALSLSNYWRERAITIRSVTSAIIAAHHSGFLHRDIKPSNILRSNSGEIKVTDFGLARATSESSLSLTGEALGTPSYMAPEQVVGKQSKIDERTDIYGIGATLYELLTDRPPLVGSSTAETLQQVLYAEPKPPRIFVPSVPRDLESICLKCLEKNAERRYRSALELQDDIDRFMQGRSTLARPVTRIEKSRRWLVTHPTQSLISMGLVASLIGLLVTTTWYLAKLSSLTIIGRSQSESLSQAVKREQISDYLVLKSRIQTRIAEHGVGWTWDTKQDIRKALKLAPSPEERQSLRDLLIQTLNAFDIRKQEVVAKHLDPYGLAWTADGSRLAIGENVTRTLDDGTEAYVIYLLGDWPARLLKEIQLPATEPESIVAGLVDGIRSLVFLEDNRSLVVGSRNGWIQIVDVESGEVTSKWKAHNDWCYGLAFDPVRSWIVSGSRDKSICIWDLKTNAKLADLTATGTAHFFAILEDKIVALGTEHDSFRLSDFTRTVETLPYPTGYTNLARKADGRSLLFASNQKVANVDTEFNDIQEFVLRRIPFSQSFAIGHIDLSSTENWVAVSAVETALFLDAVSRREMLSLSIPGGGAKYVTFDRKGDCLWIANNYELIKYDLHLPEIWKTTPVVPLHTTCRANDQGSEMLFAVLGAHRDFIGSEYRPVGSEHFHTGTIILENVPTNSTAIESLFMSINDKHNGLTCNSSAAASSWIRLWDCSRNKLSPTNILENFYTSRTQTAFCCSRDGKYYWMADRFKSPAVDLKVGRLRVFRIEDGAIVRNWENLESERKLRLSGFLDVQCGNKRTVALCADRILRVYDSVTLDAEKEIHLGDSLTPRVVAINHNESFAYVGTQEGGLMIVDLNKKNVVPFHRGDSEVTALAHSIHDILAVGYDSGEVELWSNYPSGPTKLCRLTKFHNIINKIEFSADGTQLALLVEGELAGRILDWKAFRNLLKEYNVDWE